MPELTGFAVFAIVIVVLAVVYVLMGAKAVPQGMEYTVERFGRYTRTLVPGLHLIIPYMDRIGAKLNMMEQVLDVPTQEVITRDNAMVAVDGVVFFQVVDCPRAAYEVRDLTRAMLNLALTNIRTVMGSMDLDSLLSQRDVINQRLLGVIDEAIPEPLGGAHRDHRQMAANLKGSLIENLKRLEAIPTDELLEQRYQKFRRIGVFEEGAPDPAQTESA